MLKRVLVPLDGSAFAERALVSAAALARAADAAVDLLLVYEEDPFVLAAGQPPISSDRTLAEEYLERMAALVDPDWPANVGRQIVTGDPAEQIAARAKKVRADLIVMSTHGRTGISRAWIGSVADGVVRSSAAPVLLLRATEDGSAPAPTTFRHLLVPIDESAASAQILEPASALAKRLDARVTLVRVVVPVPLMAVDPFNAYARPVSVDEAATVELEREASRYVARMAADLQKRRGIRLETRVVRGDRVAAAILGLADELRADLVAMTTSGRGASRFIVGSVADKVLRGATTPLLLFKPSAAKAKPRPRRRRPAAAARKRVRRVRARARA